MTKEYITKRLTEGATPEEIATEFSNMLNEAQKEQEEKNQKTKDFRVIADLLIDYINKYCDVKVEYLTDEELAKAESAIPSIIALTKSMERLNALTIKTFEKVNDEPVKTASFTLSPDSIINDYVNELFNM